MKLTKFLSLMALTSLVILLPSCQTPEVRPDRSPSPADGSIDQFRLELSGCGYSSQIGMLACVPGSKAKAVTEFPGVVSMVSASTTAKCSLDRTVEATPPLTEITIPKRAEGAICSVLIIYQPKFPNRASSQPIRTLLGEVTYLPDARYTPKGNVALTVFQFVELKFPKAIRGAYANRTTPDVVHFTGDTLRFQPRKQGTDLIQVVVWYEGGVQKRFVYNGNYYSPAAEKLLVKRSLVSGRIRLEFPSAVSVVMVNGKHDFDLMQELPREFTGYVRAYTAQGRTAVLYYKEGVLQWSR